jgi:hypothetical protein
VEFCLLVQEIIYYFIFYSMLLCHLYQRPYQINIIGCRYRFLKRVPLISGSNMKINLLLES